MQMPSNNYEIDKTWILLDEEWIDEEIIPKAEPEEDFYYKNSISFLTLLLKILQYYTI